MSKKGSEIKAGHFYAAAYNGNNGDLILGKVKSVRIQGEVVLTNLLSGGTSTKSTKILLVRNRRVTKKQAESIVTAYQRTYQNTKSKDKARQAARALAVSLTKPKPVKKPVPKKTPAQSTYGQRCQAADNAIRKKMGWGSLSWVGINWQDPKSLTEDEALRLVKERFPQSVTVHVYDIVDLVVELLNDVR